MKGVCYRWITVRALKHRRSRPQFWLRVLLLIPVGLLASACSSDNEPAGQATTEGRPATAALPEPAAESAAPPVRQRAESALRAQRLFAPPGDNALELFLQVLADTPNDAYARDALQDLFPYAVLHVDQRLAAGDRAEATRLLVLLRQAQPDAPALPRLQRSLDALAATPSAATVTPSSPPTLPTQTTTAEASLASAPPGSAVPEPPQQAAPAAPPSAAPPAQTTPAPVLQTDPERTAAASPNAEPAQNTPSTSVTLPRLLRQTAPRYPTVAGRRKQEGLVELAYTIAPSGRVVDVEVIRSEPAGVFDRAAVTAIEDWRYDAPAQSLRTTRTFEFKMD